MKFSLPAAGLCLCGFVSITSLRAQSAHFPTNEDLRHFKRMQDPRLSPDGQHILLRVTDATADGGKSHLWLVGVAGEEPRQLTYSPDADKRGEHDGEWMPDGRSVLFLAKRGEHTLLYQLPMEGGEAKGFELKVAPVVDQSKSPDALPVKEEGDAPGHAKAEVAIDVSRYAVAPDGKTVAIIADDPQTPGEKAQKDAKADAQWVDHNPHGARLYLLTVATGKLMPVPVEPDVRFAYWSHDSAKLLVVADGMNSAADLGPAMSSWLVQAADAGRPEKVTGLPATIEGASWSLDGKSIVYLAQARQDAPPGYPDLYAYDTAARTAKNLSDKFRGSLRSNPPVSVDGDGVVMVAETGFHGKIARYGPDGGEPQLLESPASNVSMVVTNSGRTGWVMLGSGGGKPPQLYFARNLGATFTPVKTPALAPEHLLSVAPKAVEWKSGGLTIEGLLYLPPQADHVPLIVEVHGGPLGAYSDAHEPWIDFLLGQGWAVLRTNPRGSSGYGAAFAAANKNDLGGGDYHDIMAGVDFVLKTEPLDGNRMALMGYSYGGEMAAFVEGKTDRFKAIISGAPVIDQHSEYGTEDASWYDRWYFGKSWEHPEDAWRQSPLAGAGRAKTPFLLLQGESDATDPLGQSKEMYRALRQEGVPVQLVVYPRDDHGPLAMALYGAPVPEPWHGFDARRRVVEFIRNGFEPSGK